MGLHISHLDTVTIKGERSLYLYLLDYGWRDGKWEQLLKKHFMTIADKTSKTNSVVISSSCGVHFGNEVLSYHQVGSLDADRVLPGLLITKTHPDYFKETFGPPETAEPGMKDLLVIPLEPFCTTETDFLRAINGIFEDLENGSELKNFSIAQHDIRHPASSRFRDKFVEAIELKPGIFGLNVDLRKIFAR
jgi:hypothetical protein